MPARRNGNGKHGGEGAREDVPRWVRTLFDHQERRMAALDRAHEEHAEKMAEMKAEHETRMADYERHIDHLERSQKALDERERQRARAIVQEFSLMDRERKAESARNVAEHREMMAALKDLRDSLRK